MTTGTWIFKDANKHQVLIKHGSMTETKVEVIAVKSDVPELPYNTFRFKFSIPMDNPPTDSRFIITKVDNYTWDYHIMDNYINSSGWFAGKFNNLNYTVSLIGFGDIKGGNESTTLIGLFQECTSLKSIDCEMDLSNFTSFNYAFSNCTQLEDITNIKFIKLPEYAWVNNIFENCYSIKNDMSNIYELFKNAHYDSEMEGLPFTNCGIDPNGNYASNEAQEGRSKIPAQWGGDLIEI